MSNIRSGLKSARVSRRAFVAGMVASTSLRPARAQGAYPVRPVRIIVPTGAGAALDTAARGLAARLEKRLGATFFIENKPGANSAIGTEFVARSAPDGYTLLYTSQSLTVNPSLYKVSFDTATAFAPIATVATTPITLVVPSSSRFHSVRELVQAAKTENLTYGSAGIGSPMHLAAELFAQKIGATFRHVPYKGAAQALTDLLGGRLDLAFPSLTLTQGFVTQVRVLGIASPERSALVPEMPTIAEMGLPGFSFTSWSGILAPAGTPDDVLNKLEGAVRDTLEQADTKAFLATQGLDPNFRGRRAFAEFIPQEIAAWSQILAGVKLN